MTSNPACPSKPPAPDEAKAAPGEPTTRVPSPAPASASTEDAETRRAMESLMARRRRRRRRKVIVLVVVLAVVAGAVAFAALGSLQPDPSMEVPAATVTVTRQDYTDDVKASGRVEPVESVQVTPEVDGIIQKVYVRQGDHVEKGDPLLLIGNDTLDNAVRDAELQLRSARNQLQSAREAYQAAYDAYYADQTGSVDVSSVNSAVDAVDAAQLALEGAQAAYDDAVANANKRTVLAPASGSVVVMNAVEGAQAGAAGVGAATGSSGALIMIGDLSQMSVTVQVNELDIAKVQVGQHATATFSALPDLSLDSEVTNIASVSSADASSAGYGGTVVTYAVRLLIPEPDDSLKPGMTANVDITCESIPGALTVPASAIGTGDDGSSYVCVVTGWDGTVPTTERRAVDVRAQGGSDVVVEGDVSEGDEVLEDAQSEFALGAPAPSDVAA